MFLLLIYLSLVSHSIAMDCPGILAQFSNPEIVKMRQEIEQLNIYYQKLDKEWDRLDFQAMTLEQQEIAREMGKIHLFIEALQKKIRFFEEKLSPREEMEMRLRVLEAEAYLRELSE